MLCIFFAGTSIPKSELIFPTFTVIFFSSRFEYSVVTSICKSVTVPQFKASIRLSARFNAFSVVYSLTPFSNSAEESECCPRALAVFLTLSRANFAASNKTSSVPFLISLSSPPITPASATGLSLSHITRFSRFSSNSFPSSVVIFSPFSARRTTISLPSSVLKSNACIGCPISSSTKFVMSTILFIERSPQSASFFLSQSGEGAILTSFT